MLLDLHDGHVQQRELELDDPVVDRRALMGAVDALNDRYGRSTIAVASAGLAGSRRPWVMRQDLKTPCYTTSWDDMPVARA